MAGGSWMSGLKSAKPRNRGVFFFLRPADGLAAGRHAEYRTGAGDTFARHGKVAIGEGQALADLLHLGCNLYPVTQTCRAGLIDAQAGSDHWRGRVFGERRVVA